jgi:hypothetical protein
MPTLDTAGVRWTQQLFNLLYLIRDYRNSISFPRPIATFILQLPVAFVLIWQGNRFGIEVPVLVQVTERDAILREYWRFPLEQGRMTACVDLRANVTPKVRQPRKYNDDEQKIEKPHCVPRSEYLVPQP